MKRQVPFQAVALVLHKNYIKYGKYKFPDPFQSKGRVLLVVDRCGGMSVSFSGGRPAPVLTEDKLLLTTCYTMECQVSLDARLVLVPSKEKPLDWPRSGEGRRFLEDAFLDRMHYFIDNILYLSDRDNKHDHLMRLVRPIGSEDIIHITFSLDGKLVAQQGNSLSRLIMMQFKDDTFWPRTSHITRSFKKQPTESLLLLRARALINTGFYQEAVLIAFSVLDAVVQELVKKRLKADRALTEAETAKYLMNIGKDRLATILGFILKCVDGSSIEEKEPRLASQITRLNRKRNRIIHSGEFASKCEALEAVSVVADVLSYLNKEHKGVISVPKAMAHMRKVSGATDRERVGPGCLFEG